jgi:uncharacterized protein YndB with AHSA1/START domain
MPDIVRELTIAAAPQRVWDALTQPDEIARWWTDDVSITPEIGSLAEFRFSQGTFVIQFEVAELDQDKLVRWITRQGPATGHWAGTSVTWQLEPVRDGTKLVFNHDQFAQADRRYELTRAWWEHFLGSLKSYLETGKGTPGSVAFRFERAGTPMSAIVEGRIIAAAPGRVWAALTNPDEITRWWSSEAQVTPEVGTLAEFRFRPPAGSLQFEVAEVEQGKHMRWMSRQGPPQWARTSVTWHLEPVQSGTNLVFTHEGFARVDEAYEATRGNWRFFLDSLKSYLETGQGSPGTPPSVKTDRLS